MSNPTGFVALRGEDSVGCLVAWSLAHRDSGNWRSSIDNLVGLEALLDVLVELLFESSIALDIEREELFRRSLLDDTTIEVLARDLKRDRVSSYP